MVIRVVLFVCLQPLILEDGRCSFFHVVSCGSMTWQSVCIYFFNALIRYTEIQIRKQDFFFFFDKRKQDLLKVSLKKRKVLKVSQILPPSV